MFGIATSQTKAPILSKADFVANIPDVIKAEGYEYELFEAALPEQISGADDINQAISDALGADYYGPIEDTVDVLKTVKSAKDTMILAL